VPLPPLDEPLPKDSGWVTVSGEIVCVYTSMVPFIGTDLYFAPSAKLDDGIIWLMIVKGFFLSYISFRIKMLKVLILYS